jgi:hypothetical protein
MRTGKVLTIAAGIMLRPVSHERPFQGNYPTYKLIVTLFWRRFER